MKMTMSCSERHNEDEKNLPCPLHPKCGQRRSQVFTERLEMEINLIPMTKLGVEGAHTRLCVPPPSACRRASTRNDSRVFSHVAKNRRALRHLDRSCSRSRPRVRGSNHGRSSLRCSCHRDCFQPKITNLYHRNNTLLLQPLKIHATAPDGLAHAHR